MRRRALISLLGGTTATWPLATRAQLPANLPTIGFLGTASPSSWSTFTSAFEERLRELRWAVPSRSRIAGLREEAKAWSRSQLSSFDSRWMSLSRLDSQALR
jgi:hypothetical protein